MMFFYGYTAVKVEDGWVEVRLPDGVMFLSDATDTPELRAQARAAGYGDDLWAAVRDRARLHAMLAHMLGMVESLALRAAVSKQPTELSGLEDDLVLAIQQFVNRCRKEGLQVMP